MIFPSVTVAGTTYYLARGSWCRYTETEHERALDPISEPTLIAECWKEYENVVGLD